MSMSKLIFINFKSIFYIEFILPIILRIKLIYLDKPVRAHKHYLAIMFPSRFK